MGANIVFWTTEATAHVTYGGSLPGEAGAENYYLMGKKVFQRKKSCCPWALLTVQFEVYIFPFKEKGAIASYTLRNVIQSFFIHSPEIFGKA